MIVKLLQREMIEQRSSARKFSLSTGRIECPLVNAKVMVGGW